MSEQLWGGETTKAIDNFPVSGETIPPSLVKWLGLIKANAARANADLGLLDAEIADRIAKAGDEVGAGKYDDQFPIDIFQTGSGTSSNMNTNEVIANLAGEGVHPNDHVNMGQSSNDVFPSAVHLAALDQVTHDLLPAMEQLSERGRWQAFIAPPYIPYAPLLAARGIDTRQVLLVHPKNRQDLLWSTEQALRSGTCSAVFSWLGTHNYSYSELRKLQVAASGGDSLAVLFRPTAAAHNHSPASLRLQMREYRRVHILKQRGGNQHIDVDLPPAEDVPGQPQLWELPVWQAGRQHGAAMEACSPMA